MPFTINFANLTSDLDWVGALAEILIHAAGQTEANEEDTENLQNILSKFQQKLPTRASLKPLREIASEISTVVMINIIDGAIDKINDNNKELTKLANKLNVQVRKLNTSASLLKTIKIQIDKAIEVVKTAKKLEEGLQDKNPSKIEKLDAIITALGDLGKIFKPEE